MFRLNRKVRASLEGRLRLLRNESIRQALRRIIEEAFPGQPEIVRGVDNAYALRSQMIHSGAADDRDLDLELETTTVSRTIRELYARLLKRELVSK